eukprot:Lankesteria_metandrocarpae@DN4381_c0_g1_i1.p1
MAFGGSSSGGRGGGAEISQIYERNQEATVYMGNLDSRIDEELLWELCVQCGPVRNVHIPRDKITGAHQSYGFVEFEDEPSAEYAMKVLNMIKLHGKPLRCNKASQDKRTLEVGANLFIGNLDLEVDEKLLHDTFATFGNVLSIKVMRDPSVGESRGFGFVAYDSFEASDASLAAMNGQFLCNRPIHVSYAYKKDTKGERHGSAAERLIAANRPSEVMLPSSPAVLPFRQALSAPVQQHQPPPQQTPAVPAPRVPVPVPAPVPDNFRPPYSRIPPQQQRMPSPMGGGLPVGYPPHGPPPNMMPHHHMHPHHHQMPPGGHHMGHHLHHPFPPPPIMSVPPFGGPPHMSMPPPSQR